MIVTEYYKTRNDGVDLQRTYSDEGYLLERNGVFYVEAIDPKNSGRTYVETNILVDKDVTTEDTATVEDYQNALSELGVNLDA